MERDGGTVVAVVATWTGMPWHVYTPRRNVFADECVFASGDSECGLGSVDEHCWWPNLHAEWYCALYSCALPQMCCVVGTNFGRAGTVTVVYSASGGAVYNAVGCAVTAEHLVVSCTSAVGVGRNLAFTVRAAKPLVGCHFVLTGGTQINVGGQTSTQFVTAYSYAPPSVTGLVAPLLTTLGGDTIVVSGTNFGPTGTPATVTYGSYTATSCQVECLQMCSRR